MISWFEVFASVIVGAPLTGHFFTKPFVNWFSLGIPIGLPSVLDTEKVLASEVAGARRVRILHAPSKPILKGTARIREAISNLRNVGYAIDYVEIKGQPNAIVQDELAKCDFVVDQVYSDTPLAGLATEAAAHGKPSVVGGYGLKELKAILNKAPWPPSETCHPDSMQESIEKLIKEPEYRIGLGISAREFVATTWLTSEVAKRYLRVINGQIPQFWWYDPGTIQYPFGCGQSEHQTKQIVKKLIERYGAHALRLRRESDLEWFLELTVQANRTA
jgi:hypothetical protein